MNWMPPPPNGTPQVNSWHGCHAHKDGECHWERCPQLRDGEPAKSGRHCPIDRVDDETSEPLLTAEEAEAATALLSHPRAGAAPSDGETSDVFAAQGGGSNFPTPIEDVPISDGRAGLPLWKVMLAAYDAAPFRPPESTRPKHHGDWIDRMGSAAEIEALRDWLPDMPPQEIIDQWCREYGDMDYTKVRRTMDWLRAQLTEQARVARQGTNG